MFSLRLSVFFLHLFDPPTVLGVAVSALTVSLPALHSICIIAPSSYSDFCISSVNVYINRAAQGGSGGLASTQSALWPFAASCQEPALLKKCAVH